MLKSFGIANESLVAGLVEQVREVADSVASSEELELDINLNGRPVEVSAAVAEAVSRAVHDALEATGLAQELRHLAFAVDYRNDVLYVKIEHDGLFDAPSRSRAEEMVLSVYGRIGLLGGSVAFSLGRGFGLRLELTVPYSETALYERGEVRSSLPMGAPSRSAAPIVERLTPQEEACLALLAAGFSNKEIASRLHISVGTVKFHLAQIYQKLDVQGRGRGAAVARARELGLIFD